VAQAQAAPARTLASLRTPTAMTTLTNVVILGGNALAGIVSARALGPAGRGQLAVVMLWPGLISMVGMLGLPSACCYYVAHWPARSITLAAHFRRAAARQAVVMTAVSALFLWWLHYRLRLQAILTIEYTVSAAGTAIALYGTCFVQGLGDFTRFNLIRLVSAGLSVAPMLAIAFMVHLTPAEAGLAYLVPTWCSAALGWSWLRGGGRPGDTRPLSRPERHAIRWYGWRSVASLTGLTINRSADQLILGLFVPVGSLGLYMVAASASSPLPYVVASLGMVGLPTVAALPDQAKATATWKALGRATYLLAILAPACAALIPLAVPAAYGRHYSAAVIPAELLLIGAVFTALTAVADDLLRAHGNPGFVSITQGAGGAVTIVGTLLLARRSLTEVALVSSLGFAVAFVLALIRLWVATRRTSNTGATSATAGRHRVSRAAGPMPQPADRDIGSVPR
jgi:O-antigen/teichoic acid export membrane protein